MSGSTTESGVRALTVNGEATSVSSEFSFTRHQGRGSYIRLVLWGLQDRVFNYVSMRVLSGARETLLHRTPSALSGADANNMYDGKMLMYEGTLISKEDKADSWVLRLALAKTDAGHGLHPAHLRQRAGLPGQQPGPGVRADGGHEHRRQRTGPGGNPAQA